jgi:tetratricopeptide (TPR) repeat protein
VPRGVRVGEYFFVSYSAVDAADFALSLADKLTAGPPSYHLWVDRRELQPGDDWDEQIVEAIRGCRGLLLVMTADSVRAGSVSKDEWVRALKYKKPVIPLRLHAEAELPFRLGSRQFVDFSDVEVGMARLREYLAWTSTPEGVLAELRTRRADAERELPRADPARRPQIEREIADLNQRIAAQRQAIDHPLAAQTQTAERIETGLERERQPEKPVTKVVVSRARFVNPPPMAAPGHFQDRHVETGQVADFLRTAGLRVMTVVGRGGLGKTAMACRLLKALEGEQLPDDGGELAVAGIVYLSPVGGHPVNFPNLFADLCRLLPEDDAEALTERYRDPQQAPGQLMLALLEAFPAGATAGPSVVLLDNLEDHIDAETGAITDPPLDEALHALLAGPDHAVKVILTTRVAPRELLLVQPGRQRRLNMDEGLGSPFAENILRAMDPDASLGLRHAPDELLALARKRTRGFPRALEALAAILSADRDTTLEELLAETARLPGNVIEALVGEAFSRLDPLAQQVMQALAVFPVPVPAVAVDFLLQPYRATINAVPVLGRLVNMAFVRRDAGRYYLHQVDRDYALARIPAGEAADRDTDPPPFTQQALRNRGATYFEVTRTARETWKTLDDLGPQLAEFELRFQGDDYDAAAAVMLGIDMYLLRWGHYRLAIELHNRLQGRLIDPWAQASNHHSLGDFYQMTGAVKAAIEHYQQLLVIARETGDRRAEGVAVTGLAGGFATLGQTDAAIEHYQQALAIDRETGNRDDEAVDLRGLAGGFAILGQTGAAIEHYQQALAISRETGNRDDQAASLSGLASGYATLGQTDAAIEHYRQALTISRETGNRSGEAASLNGLGYGLATLGQTDAAIEHYRQALAISRETGNRSGEAASLNGLADGFATLGQTDAAIEHYRQALAIYRETGNRDGEAASLSGLANGYTTLGQTDAAIGHYRQALAISRETGDLRAQGVAITGLANGFATLGQTDAAIEHYRQALAIDRETGNRDDEAVDLSGLAEGLTTLGQTDAAIGHYRQALTISRKTGNRDGEAASLNGLADSLATLGQTDAAIEHYQQALAILRKTGNRGGEATVLNNLGSAHADQGTLQISAEYCRQAVTISDETGDVQVRCEARLTLAKTQLWAGDLADCRTTIEAARGYDYPPASAEISLIQGIVLLRQGSRADAVARLAEAVSAANAVLQRTERTPRALNIRALALSGLVLTNSPSHIDDAVRSFRAARAITTAPGILGRALRLLDAITAADPAGTLDSVRNAAIGR